MDKLEQYQIAIKQVLTEYHNWVSGAANLSDESCLIFDDNHHHIWCFLGWDGKKELIIFKLISELKMIKFG